MSSRTLRFQSTTGQAVATLEAAASETVKDIKSRLLAKECSAVASLDFTQAGVSDIDAFFFEDRMAAINLPQSLVVWQWTGGDGASMRAAGLLSGVSRGYEVPLPRPKLAAVLECYPNPQSEALQHVSGWNEGASLLTTQPSPPLFGAPQCGHKQSASEANHVISRLFSGDDAIQPGARPYASFDDVMDDALGGENLLRGIYSYGFEKPSAIQAWAMPQILRGKSVVAIATSGTGKTAAFLIPVLGRIHMELKICQAIVVAPSRELANQITKVALALGDYLRLRCHTMIGGTSVRDDINKLKDGQHLICGSHGRMLDMINKGHLKTESVKVLVVDDADEILQDEGLGALYRALPWGLQVCIFSATMPEGAMRKAERFAPGALHRLVPTSLTIPEQMRHFYLLFEKDEKKIDTVYDLFEACSSTQTLMFFDSRRKVDWAADQLIKRDFTAWAMLHADLDQKERDLVMREFRSGSARVLLTNSLLARGIDVQQVSFVVNYDMPNNTVEYAHRAGRCCRFGRKGVVLSFLLPGQERWREDVRSAYQVEISELPMDFAELL